MARWNRAGGCAGTRGFRALSLCAVVVLGTLACLLAVSRTAGAQAPAGTRVLTSQKTVTVPLVARDYASPGVGNTLSRFGVGTPAQPVLRVNPISAMAPVSKTPYAVRMSPTAGMRRIPSGRRVAP